jgi:hypothetical protein
MRVLPLSAMQRSEDSESDTHPRSLTVKLFWRERYAKMVKKWVKILQIYLLDTLSIIKIYLCQPIFSEYPSHQALGPDKY